MHENTLNLRSVGEMGVLAYRYVCPYFSNSPRRNNYFWRTLFAHRFTCSKIHICSLDIWNIVGWRKPESKELKDLSASCMRRGTASSPLSDPKIDPRRPQQRPGGQKVRSLVLYILYSALIFRHSYCSISDSDEFLCFIRTDLVATAEARVKPRRILTLCSTALSLA